MMRAFECRGVIVDGITYRVSFRNGIPCRITTMVQRASRKEPGLTVLVQRHLWDVDGPKPISARAKRVLDAV